MAVKKLYATPMATLAIRIASVISILPLPVEISGGFCIGEFCGKGAYADCTAGNMNCVRKCNAAVAVNIAEKNGGVVVGVACNNVDALVAGDKEHALC